jgi:hypothetical protein
MNDHHDRTQNGMDIIKPVSTQAKFAGHGIGHQYQSSAPREGSPSGHFGHPTSSATTASTLSDGGSRHGSFVSQNEGTIATWRDMADAQIHDDGDVEVFHRSGPEVAPAPRQPSVEEILADSVASFYRDGPLVNPLEARRAKGAAGWNAPKDTSTSTVKEKMQFVADVKGFDYGIFWRYAPERRVFEFDDFVNVGDDVGGGASGSGLGGIAARMSLFIRTSRSMFQRWIVGFGMAGRVGYTGNYEWHEEVTTLPAWSFQRLRQAKDAGLRTIVGIPTAQGVVEFGSTQLLPHNVSTVQYVQKIMGEPRGAARK